MAIRYLTHINISNMFALGVSLAVPLEFLSNATQIITKLFANNLTILTVYAMGSTL